MLPTDVVLDDVLVAAYSSVDVHPQLSHNMVLT
jgi:hypothetical protein